jgi:hypothetical protein
VVAVTITWKNLRPGFVSAWDTARSAYGPAAFDALSRDGQIQAVKDYINR